MSESLPQLTSADWADLFRVAHGSIEQGLAEQEPLSVDPTTFSPILQVVGRSFVTLKFHQQLRGCMGNLQADRPLVLDVAQNAFSAAFRDPRFPPLVPQEYQELELEISVLGPDTPMSFSSEADLLRQLVPGQDGLTLSVGSRRGTFLPSVWHTLPEPADFLRALKRKARLSDHYWGADVHVSRYHTVSRGESDLS